MGIDAGLYPVRHQAFITRRLPMLGKHGTNLDMLIDRQITKVFLRFMVNRLPIPARLSVVLRRNSTLCVSIRI